MEGSIRELDQPHELLRQAPERSLVRHAPPPPPPLHLAKDERLHREWHDRAVERIAMMLELCLHIRENL